MHVSREPSIYRTATVCFMYAVSAHRIYNCFLLVTAYPDRYRVQPRAQLLTLPVKEFMRFDKTNNASYCLGSRVYLDPRPMMTHTC